MKFDLPFSDATITSLVGKTVVLSDNHRNEAMFKPVKVIQVKGGGDFIGGNLEVQNGVLRIMEKQGLFCEFSGIETRNGSVFAVGASAHTISRDGHHRIIMHEMVPMVKAGTGGLRHRGERRDDGGRSDDHPFQYRQHRKGGLFQDLGSIFCKGAGHTGNDRWRYTFEGGCRRCTSYRGCRPYISFAPSASGAGPAEQIPCGQGTG